MRKQPIVQVDAFTDRPYAGNAAAVCVLEEPHSGEWMQRLAQETNLPATVFLAPQEDGYAIRWFTAVHELSLCGHGTLAGAHVLWSEGYAAPEQSLLLYSQNNTLTARREAGWITLEFPAVRNAAVTPPEALLQGLGREPRYVGKSWHSYLVEVDTEAQLRALTPDVPLLARLDVASVIVTSQAELNSPYDFISRYFAPSHGVAEDAVTGSAHCCLGPYWAERLGKTEMIGYQASARGGVVRVGVNGDQVTLGGQAVTVIRGELS